MASGAFETFQQALEAQKEYFNKELGIKIEHNVQPFNPMKYNLRDLAAVVLMLIHNVDIKKSPNINDLDKYDTLEKMSKIDVKLFDPYIKALREQTKKKDEKASKEITNEERIARFQQTFLRYIDLLRMEGLKLERRQK